MKRLLPALLAMSVLLSGCGADTANYPYVEASQPEALPPMELVITVPNSIDDITENTLVLLESKLKELSNGSIQLVTLVADNMAENYRDGGTGLYLMDNRQLEQLDDRMTFARMPFIFEDREHMLAVLNSDSGAVRSSQVTRNRLEGELLGAYYAGTTWMLGRGTFYDEMGFYGAVGVLEGAPSNGCFSAIGSEKLVVGSQEDILEAYAQSEVRFCEITPQVQMTGQSLKITKRLELTNHRYEVLWTVLKNPQKALDGRTVNIIKEAYAYTYRQQNTFAIDREMAQIARLESNYELTANEDEQYTQTRTQARKFYRNNWKLLGIPADIAGELDIGQGNGLGENSNSATTG